MKVHIFLIFFFCTGGMGQLFRANIVNQASSDSELAKNRAKFADSFNELDGELGHSREEQVKDHRGPIFLPNVANMKHNVSEKVAQVNHVPSFSFSFFLFCCC